MSIKKLNAPMLLPSCSAVVADSAGVGAGSAVSIPSTVSRIRSTASAACSSPRTDKTPRICAIWRGTATSAARFCGSRKNKSSEDSSSLSEARNSPTTLPIVCLSLTLRYKSSIHPCSGSGLPPERTFSSRSARLAMRPVICESLGSRSSNAASKYNTEVATSIASSERGALPAANAVSTAWLNACANGSLGAWSLVKESATRLNWSVTAFDLLKSPADKNDHISLATMILLRAWASSAGSNRPNWTAS